MENFEKLESLFWWSNLNILKNTSAKREMFSLWTWLLEIPADYLNKARNLDPTKAWEYSLIKSSPSQLLNPWEKTVHNFNIHFFCLCYFLTLLTHQVHHYMWFSHYHQVFPKFGPHMEHFYTTLYGNDQTISVKSHIF